LNRFNKLAFSSDSAVGGLIHTDRLFMEQEGVMQIAEPNDELSALSP
jgi:hypothetical protein